MGTGDPGDAVTSFPLGGDLTKLAVTPKKEMEKVMLGHHVACSDNPGTNAEPISMDCAGPYKHIHDNLKDCCASSDSGYAS